MAGIAYAYLFTKHAVICASFKINALQYEPVVLINKNELNIIDPIPNTNH